MFYAGKEFCKKMEVYYCEMCMIYMPLQDDIEQQLSLHYRNHMHLQRCKQYVDGNKSDELTDNEVDEEVPKKKIKSLVFKVKDKN